ncbi:MAG: ATP-binding protein [Coleofasciculus chthonoplastes F3-SA18-01]|uniref:AAA family ATPase n=1 Tax=Coleofasciculus chthonoplastes TaxID=64178 RepID=UPI0032F7FF3C
MTQTPAMTKFRRYCLDCLQILYWAYLKPFTFERWLGEIHPELTPRSNPFLMQAEFRRYPRLRRYADQVWWLTVLVPLLIALFVAPIYSFSAGEPFYWQRSSLFLVGWLMGLVVARGGNEGLGEWFTRFFWISVGINLAGNVLSRLAPEMMEALPILNLFLSNWFQLVLLEGVVVRGMVRGVAFNVAGCVAFSVAFGVALSVALNVAVGVTVGVTVGVAGSVAGNVIVLFGVYFGVCFSVLFGVYFGVAVGVAVGVAFGVAWILGVLRVYFWIPEFLWMVGIGFLSRQGDEAQFLRYLPPRFDELIILPLPFMAELIIAAYRDNPAASRQTIDYLIHSTNQQNVAALAMTGIAVDSLSHCHTTGDIISISDQLAWIPSPPPAKLSRILPQFLEISQSVRASYNATSSYRQFELLQSPITALEQLRNTLAYSQNPQLATSFGSIVQQWLKILQTAQQTLAEQAKRSAEIPQVYIAGASLNPDDAKTRFKGRQDIFREIETLALSAQPPILLLHGGRRTGKTSTLKYLPRKVGSELIPLLIDLQGAATATTLNGLANYLAEEIVKAAKKSRNFDLPYPNPQQLNQEPFLTLQTWLEKLERIAPGKRFLLCLDEFERLSEVIATTNSRVPLNFLRHVLQHRRQWILLFSGSHTLDELEPYWSDYLINTRSLRVSYLQKPEAEELIVEPIADFPKIYESLTVSQIIQATRCQPYLVQLLCTVIVDHLNREKRRLATPDDVQTCIPIAIETGGMYFRELWTSLSEPEQDFLEYLITEETPHPQNKSTVRRLIRKEILEKREDCYRFQVPLVETFITQVVTEG